MDPIDVEGNVDDSFCRHATILCGSYLSWACYRRFLTRMKYEAINFEPIRLDRQGLHDFIEELRK